MDLSRCVKVTDTAIKHLLSLSALEKLSISETGVTSDGVSLLGSLLNLSELDLGGLPVSDQTLISLQVICFVQSVFILISCLYFPCLIRISC